MTDEDKMSARELAQRIAQRRADEEREFREGKKNGTDAPAVLPEPKVSLSDFLKKQRHAHI